MLAVKVDDDIAECSSFSDDDVTECSAFEYSFNKYVQDYCKYTYDVKHGKVIDRVPCNCGL
jgi:hypothetical protein